MENRTKHTYAIGIYEFAKHVLVECPHCAGKAIVKIAETHSKELEISNATVVCAGCGFNRMLEKISKRHDPKQKRGKKLIYGAPIDPYFHLPVWLQMELLGEVLWAYNLEHLEFLAEHVGAKLRERSGANLNRSIGSRLPRWMSSAGNRAAVLQAIEKLKDK